MALSEKAQNARKKYLADYRQTHKEKLKEYQRKYAAEHREQVNANNRKWRAANPERCKAIAARYWEKKAAAAEQAKQEPATDPAEV